MKAGQIIAERFRLDYQLGAGGLGVVWAATQLNLDRSVAVKFLKSPAHDDLKRFEAEARALARMQHEGCVTMHEFGRTDDGVPFIVMERVNGETLDQLRGQRVELPRVLDYLEQLLRVLQYAHNRRVAHRDLKPSNVILTRDGQLKVLDFGLAKITALDSVDLTKTGEVFGSPVYMSPEQLRGSRDAGPPSDIYALGVIAFELLGGHPPYGGDSMLQLAMGHLGQIPPPIDRDDCPAEIKRLIADMLAKDPDRRPTAAQALSRVNPEATRPTSIVVVERRPLALTVGLGIAVAALLGVVAFLVFSEDEPEPPVVRSSWVEVANTQLAAEAIPPDADAKVDRVVPVEREPCNAPAPGIDRITPRLGAPWAYYAPEKNAGSPRPVMIVYQTDRVEPEQMFRGSGLIQKADEHGFLLLGHEGAVKRDPQIVTSTFDALDELDDRACIDRDRLYIIGHGSGGAAAQRFGCQPEIAAIATASYNPRPARAFECTQPQPLPAIHVAPRDSGHAPLDGDSTCRQVGAMAIKDFEEAWQKRNECGKPSRTVHRSEHGTCQRWSECDAPFVACRVDGGHDWPGVDSNDPLAHCAGKPTKFEVTDVVVDFLLQHRRRALGCGTKVPESEFKLDVDIGGETRQILVSLPTDYDPNRAHPVLFTLGYTRHGSADYMLRRASFAHPANNAGYILIAPLESNAVDRVLTPWSTPSDEVLLRDALELAAEHLCIDRERVFGMSHSNGATRLQELACEVEFAGLALTGMAEHDPPQSCRPLGPPPTLRMIGRDDPFVPILGGLGCDRRQRYLSADESDEVWKDGRGFGCRGAKRPWPPRADVCETWSCETAYVSCRVGGGPFFRQSDLETDVVHTPRECQRPDWEYFDLKFKETVLPFFDQVEP